MLEPKDSLKHLFGTEDVVIVLSKAVCLIPDILE